MSKRSPAGKLLDICQGGATGVSLQLDLKNENERDYGGISDKYMVMSVLV